MVLFGLITFHFNLSLRKLNNVIITNTLSKWFTAEKNARGNGLKKPCRGSMGICES